MNSGLEFVATYRGIILDQIVESFMNSQNVKDLSDPNLLERGNVETAYYSIMDYPPPSLHDRKKQFCETYFNHRLESCVSSFDVIEETLEKMNQFLSNS